MVDATDAIKFDLLSLDTTNLESLKHLNATIFPIKYPPKFYKEIMKPLNKAFSKLAFIKNELIGAICCEVVPEKKDPARKRLCISTIGVKAEYQCRSVGSKLLKSCILAAKVDKSLQDVFLHVQTDNHDAIKFYGRFGFENRREVKNYYRRMQHIPGVPRSKHCFEMVLKIPRGEKRKRGGDGTPTFDDKKMMMNQKEDEEEKNFVVIDTCDLIGDYDTVPEVVLGKKCAANTFGMARKNGENDSNVDDLDNIEAPQST
mmetsp:Transcript_32762/g.53046  ORF Transcript_32762/g.53046 Transcript_32762/m.53046 type:complete len:259 (+) Transcript_32762:89-865(+)